MYFVDSFLQILVLSAQSDEIHKLIYLYKYPEIMRFHFNYLSLNQGIRLCAEIGGRTLYSCLGPSKASHIFKIISNFLEDFIRKTIEYWFYKLLLIGFVNNFAHYLVVPFLAYLLIPLFIIYEFVFILPSVNFLYQIIFQKLVCCLFSILWGFDWIRGNNNLQFPCARNSTIIF